MYLRRRMDSQGFVSLEFIAGFNRIKHLSADIELVKLVCQQSSVVQYRTGEDGQDRLRRREGWEQWVLNMADRDTVAQNEGPKELRQPPVPQPTGFDQSNLPQWPMSAGEPTGPYGSNGSFPQMNGYGHGSAQDEARVTDNVPNGTAPEESSDGVVPNGHPIEASTKAVSFESDSFSEAQVASLMVIVRKLDQSQSYAKLPLASRTFSNDFIDSKHDTLVRLYWIKNQEAPVHSIPPDSFQESYSQLRSKALKQRHDASLGTTPYDMGVLYQFWSHFLLRNFNTRMYDEFRYFAFQDATDRLTEVGLSNLVKFHQESLLSSQGQIRERMVRHFLNLVKVS
jgi:la-related protein 1